MEILNSRLLLTPTDPAASRRFYGDVLGLAVAREFGPPEHPGIVYFTGGGYLELSGQATEPPGQGLRIWMQVRDIASEYERLRSAGATITRPPKLEPWGLLEMWVADPDGVEIVLVEVPADHPLRRDQRPPVSA